MASIKLMRSGSYQARVRRKGSKDQAKTFSTKAEAAAWARVVERGPLVNTPPAGSLTLREALHRYSREVTPSKKGAIQELGRIKRWQRHPTLAHRPLDSLRAADLAAYRDARLASGISGNTVRLDLALISHLFEVARREWNMESLVNQVKGIRKPRVGRGRSRRLAPGEEARLLLACPPRLVPIVKLAIETGMRRSELTGLTWSSVDLKARVIHLEDTKNGDARDVPLSSRALAALEGLTRAGTDAAVFQVTADWATKAFVEAARKAGLKDLRFHDLRHEATSRLFELGLNVVEASSITGHKSLQMLKRYTHLKAVDLVAKLG